MRQYTQLQRRDSIGDDWQLIQAWREAVAAWQRAEAVYDECPCDYHAYKIKAAEERLNAMLREAREEGVTVDAEPEDDDRWLRLMDAVGRGIVWLLVVLVTVAIAGWWLTWR